MRSGQGRKYGTREGGSGTDRLVRSLWILLAAARVSTAARAGGRGEEASRTPFAGHSNGRRQGLAVRGVFSSSPASCELVELSGRLLREIEPIPMPRDRKHDTDDEASGFSLAPTSLRSLAAAHADRKGVKRLELTLERRAKGHSALRDPGEGLRQDFVFPSSLLLALVAASSLEVSLLYISSTLRQASRRDPVAQTPIRC